MRSFISMTLALFLAALFISCKEKQAAPAAETTAWVNTQSVLNMREAPDKNSKVVGTLQNNTQVTVLGVSGDEITLGGKTGKWTNIRQGTTTGWVFGGFLSPVKIEMGLEKYIPLGTYVDEKMFEKFGKDFEKAGDGINSAQCWTFESSIISWGFSGPDGEDLKLTIKQITPVDKGVEIVCDGKYMANGAEKEKYFKGKFILEQDKDRVTLSAKSDLVKVKDGEKAVLVKVR